jgi:hypothetical protein
MARRSGITVLAPALLILVAVPAASAATALAQQRPRRPRVRLHGLDPADGGADHGSCTATISAPWPASLW